MDFACFRSSLVRRLIRSGATMEDAEDASHEAFVRFHTTLPEERQRHIDQQPKAALRWMLVTSLHWLTDQYRRPKEVQTTDFCESSLGSLEGAVHSRLAFEQAFNALSHREREILTLRGAGFEHEEIAETLSISIYASKQRLHRASAHLRTAMMEQSLPDPTRQIKH